MKAWKNCGRFGNGKTQKKQRTFPFSGETAMDWNFIILLIYRTGRIYEALLIPCVQEFNIQLFKVLGLEIFK